MTMVLDVENSKNNILYFHMYIFHLVTMSADHDIVMARQEIYETIWYTSFCYRGRTVNDFLQVSSS